ncbi:MAG: 50S ribosomal protein L15 [Gemmatimonadetes bacterium]|nr:MAG: 50S ribosomal protein L15 [Gemmatimonadota bacterium]
MQLHDLKPAKGAVRKRKRVGRGQGSGKGRTAGRGHKGQRSRSGFKSRPWFEGGQMPLARRLPGKGFNNKKFKTIYQIVNVADLANLEGEVNPAILKERGLIRKTTVPVKILGDGDLTNPLTITAAAFSRSAKEKIEKAGGQAIVQSAGRHK